jgi:hypothetical protein
MLETGAEAAQEAVVKHAAEKLSIRLNEDEEEKGR